MNVPMLFYTSKSGEEVILNFSKHEYDVECLKCEHKQVNNDDGVVDIIKLITVSHCHHCAPQSGVPTHKGFLENGDEVTSGDISPIAYMKKQPPY